MSIMLSAAERVVERLMFMASEMNLHVPPKNPLTDEQQAQLYLAILASPPMIAAFRLQYGEALWQSYNEAMQYKLKILGKAGINLDPNMLRPDKDDLIEDATQLMGAMDATGDAPPAPGEMANG